MPTKKKRKRRRGHVWTSYGNTKELVCVDSICGYHGEAAIFINSNLGLPLRLCPKCKRAILTDVSFEKR